MTTESFIKVLTEEEAKTLFIKLIDRGFDNWLNVLKEFMERTEITPAEVLNYDKRKEN